MKTIKHIIQIICLFLVSNLFSQNLTPVWMKHFGNISGTASLLNYKSFYEDTDGNYIFIAFFNNVTLDTNLVNGDYGIKLLPSGEFVKIKELGESNTYRLNFDNDNNLLFLKYKNLNNGDLIHTLVKLDQNLDSLWSLNFVSRWNNYFEGTGVNNFQIDSDNNIYLPFSPNDVRTILPNGDTIFDKAFFTKISSDGEFLKTYRAPSSFPINKFDIKGDDSLFYFAVGKNIMEYDTIPQLLKNRSFSLDIYHFSIDNDNFYLSDTGIDTLYGGVANDSITENNLFIHKLDNSFNDVWIRKIKGFKECKYPPSQNLYLCRSSFRMIKTEVTDNYLYVYGAFKYKMSINNNTFYTQDSSKYSFFIMKFDKNGNYHWTEVFQSLESNIYDWENLFELKVMTDNSLLCGINFKTQLQFGDSFYTSNGEYHLLFMRLQETGTGLKPIQENKAFSFKLYPNPANDIVNIEISTDENILTGKLKIYNFLGTEVYERPVHLEKGQNNISFNISHLPQGLYFVSLETPCQKSVKKLVKY